MPGCHSSTTGVEFGQKTMLTGQSLTAMMDVSDR